MRRYPVTGDAQMPLCLMLHSEVNSSMRTTTATRCGQTVLIAGAAIAEMLAGIGFERQIHQRARHHPLTQEPKSHRRKSQPRAQVAHLFGTWVIQRAGNLVRSLGIARAKA